MYRKRLIPYFSPCSAAILHKALSLTGRTLDIFYFIRKRFDYRITRLESFDSFNILAKHMPIVSRTGDANNENCMSVVVVVSLRGGGGKSQDYRWASPLI